MLKTSHSVSELISTEVFFFFRFSMQLFFFFFCIVKKGLGPVVLSLSWEKAGLHFHQLNQSMPVLKAYYSIKLK